MGDALDVRDFGAVLDGVTDDAAAIQRAHDALPDSGGRLLLPGGAFVGSTVNLSKPVALTGLGPGVGRARPSSLMVAGGVTGLNVTGPRVAVEHVAVLAASQEGAGDGIRLNGTRFRLTNVEVSGFGGHGVRADTATFGGNANNGTLDQVRAYGNRGNGFHLAGLDANSVHLAKCDAVANGGDGFYMDSATCLLLSCHASTNGGRDFRDKGNGNVYVAPYAEDGVFEVERGSAAGVVIMGNYAEPTWVIDPSAAVTWTILAGGGEFKRAVRVSGDASDAAPHAYALESGVSSSGALRLRDLTDRRTIWTVTGSGSRFEFNVPVQLAAGLRVQYGSAGPADYAGEGSPEGVVPARMGSTYRNSAGGAGSSFYVKESGDGTRSGWVAK